MKSLFQVLAPMCDPAPMLRASRLRFGKRVRMQGVPAILFGVAAIVLAAGVTRIIDNALITFGSQWRTGGGRAWELPRREHPPLNP